MEKKRIELQDKLAEQEKLREEYQREAGRMKDRLSEVMARAEAAEEEVASIKTFMNKQDIRNKKMQVAKCFKSMLQMERSNCVFCDE